MNLELLSEGSILMVIGMGTVFSFLCILICSMFVMSRVIGFLNKIFPEAVVELNTSKKSSSSSKDDEIALAIACAIKERGGVC